MSSRHPIDEVFRDKLAQYSTESPMHLWEKIDQKRSQRKRRGLYFRVLAGLGVLLVTFALIWTNFSADQYTLNALPIPLKERNNLSIAQNKTPHLAKSETPEPNQEQIVQRLTSIPKTEKRIFTTEDKSLNAVTAEDAAEQLETSTEIEMEAKKSINTEKWASQTLPILAFQSQVATTATDFEFTDPTDCAKFKKRPWKFFATFGGAIDLARRQMTPKDADAAAYTDTRENTELPFYTFSLDARASVITPIGLGFTTGLDYTQINEKFDYVDPDAERTEIITTEYGPNGEITGIDTVLILGSREIITYNRYRILDIPLLANYELDFTHFALEVKGGILINILSRQKGDFLSPNDLEPTSFTSDEPNSYSAFRQNIGIGYYGGMSFNYKLNGGFQVSFEPFFRVYPKSFTKENFPVTQKYFLTGLKLGLKVPLR